MISYHCNKCDINVNHSECPVCGERTDSKSELFWCSNCNIPTYDSVCPICHNSCMNAYFWLKNCREIVNYKDGVFHDPETIDIWDDIIEDITKFGIKKTLTYFVDEKDKYCFLPEYAVLAIPLNRILIVAQEVKNELSEQLQDSQMDWIKSILKDNLDSEYINKLLLSGD